MFTFNVTLQPQNARRPSADPRGGVLVDLDQSDRYNNQHIQRQILPGNAAHLTPDGKPCGFMWMLPYYGNGLANVSTERALLALREKGRQPSGNAQVFYAGMQMGIGRDG